MWRLIGAALIRVNAVCAITTCTMYHGPYPSTREIVFFVSYVKDQILLYFLYIFIFREPAVK